jgi:tRNA A37 threonylcarbamoyladenosine synthetase subunit TsaC/SUA5/YrdC
MMGRPDVKADAQRALDVVRSGGVAIIPGDVGYGCVAASPEALVKIFKAKGRAANKRHGLNGDWQLHRELHILDQPALDMIDTITLDYDLPLGVIAPFRSDHPMIQKLDRDTLDASTVDNTLNVVVNVGTFQRELARVSREAGIPVLGSSANLSGTGIKSSVEEIEPEILAVADLVLDYGVGKYCSYRRASTSINFSTMTVVRAGACYDLIAGLMKRHFGIEFPPDPGFDAFPSGLFWEPTTPISSLS